MSIAAILPYFMLASSAASTATSIVGMFNTPSAPKIDADLTKKQRNDAVTAAAYAEANRLKKRAGYSSTILTGPMGSSAPVNTTQATLGA